VRRTFFHGSIMGPQHWPRADELSGPGGATPTLGNGAGTETIDGLFTTGADKVNFNNGLLPD
jgi:hypothetical protein